MYAVIYVIGIFQSKQIKTCAIVCRPYKSGVDFAPGRHFRESQPKKLKSFLAVTNRGQRKFKHFRTASEIKSYQEHPQKHKPQEMITQCACNKPASWPLNVRLSAAKTRFTQSKFRLLHALCSAREKRRKTSVQADSQGHVSHYHELMMLCLACQLLLLTGYYFTIYAK